MFCAVEAMAHSDSKNDECQAGTNASRQTTHSQQSASVTNPSTAPPRSSATPTLPLGNSAKDLHTPEGTRVILAENLNQVGIAYYKEAHYEDALRSFSRSLDTYEQGGNQRDEAVTLSEIAMCYASLGRKQRALDYLERSVTKWQAVADRENEACAIAKEGDIYRAWGFPDQALQQYKRALPYFLLAGDRSGRAVLLNNTGLAYLERHDTKHALEQFNASVALYRSLNDLRGEASGFFNIGSSYLANCNRARARESFDRVLELLKVSPNKDLEARTFKAISTSCPNQVHHLVTQAYNDPVSNLQQFNTMIKEPDVPTSVGFPRAGKKGN